jgi:DNA-binding LacI/PurR family transcriptional regulator
MVTLKDVAKEAGVSPSTASGALRGLNFVKPQTVKKVVAAATKLQYTVNESASALRTGRTNTYCLIVPNLAIPYYGLLTDELATELNSRGMKLNIQITRADEDTERQLIKQIAGSTADGLFCIVNSLGINEIKTLVEEFPTVVFESFGTNNPLDAVNTPGDIGMHDAAEHLHARGYQHIGVVGQPPFLTLTDDITVGRAIRLHRYQSAMSALQEFGLSEGSASYSCGWGPADAIGVAHDIAQQGLVCDAFLCMNDDLALGLIRGFDDCGITIPRDAAVIGFDGIDGGSYSVPTLSTISIDFAGMAETSVTMMMRQVEREPGRVVMPQRVAVGHRLVVRESTQSQG